jgi:hypothetical protein
MKVKTKTPPAPAVKQTLAPDDFAFRHYVPVLKTKLGELWALENMNSSHSQFLTPLLEVHREKSGSVSTHVTKTVGAIKKALGGRRLFLDSRWFGISGSQAVASCNDVMLAAAGASLNFHPVTALDRSAAYQSAISSYSGNGVMIRLSADDFADVSGLASRLDALALQLSLDKSQIDILIDYNAVTSSGLLVQLIRSHVAVMPSLTAWRTLTVVGGSFPASLANRTPHTWHSLDRHEWLAWHGAITGTPRLPRRPSFGDYGVRDTQPPADFGSPSANIRYTTNGTFLLRRHDVLVKDGGSSGIHAICASLRSRVEFRGRTYTAGDSQIYVKANPSELPGNAGNWTAWGMSHHFGAVVDEIQSLPAA